MVCSGCGCNDILVYSSILNGNLCTRCYDKYISGKQGRIREYETEMYKRLTGYGLDKIMFKHIVDLHKRYKCLVDPRIEFKGKDVSVEYTFRYRNCNAKLHVYAHVNDRCVGNSFVSTTIEYKTIKNLCRFDMGKIYVSDVNKGVTV